MTRKHLIEVHRGILNLSIQSALKLGNLLEAIQKSMAHPNIINDLRDVEGFMKCKNARALSGISKIWTTTILNNL